MVERSETANQVLVRKLNTSLVLHCLRTRGPLSRASLSAAIGLNRSTVSSLINGLLDENLVREIGLQASERGRPGMLLELNPAGGCAVGIEIGVDFLSITLTDFVAQPMWCQRIVSDPMDGQDVILERAEGMVQEALDRGMSQNLRPLGIGLGVPGLVDTRQGSLVFAPNLGWNDVPLRPMWTSRFDLPVFVENEANAAALGEYYFGVAQDVENLIYLSAGIGLGGGIIVNGSLFRGSSGYAGEVGHMTVDPNGELCGCGKRGCWETLVGPRAIVRRVRRAIESDGEPSQVSSLVRGELSEIDMDIVVRAARAGDKVARTALEEVGVQLGIGIANLINAFNPELVVLGGALSLGSELLLPVIKEIIRDHALVQPHGNVQVVCSAHGTGACIMGGIALVLDNVLREPQRHAL